MRIGILGGTFDPPHIAHVQLARTALAALDLSKLLIVPSGDPPYKKCHASPADRLALARLAFADVPGAEVTDIEVVRAGATYAVDTVRALASLYPGADLVYILGEDAVARLPNWNGYEELARMCAFAYAARGGACPESGCAARFEAALPDLSSSYVRARIAAGEDAGELVPADAYACIAERGLYIADMPEDALCADLAARLSPHRFLHSLGVRDTAVSLARQCGLAPGKARIAGLLHDCAKGLSEAELLARADEAGADAAERESPQVLHAPVGAHIARTRYGVRDPEVLTAIRRHTVGGPGMGILDEIIYVADYIEPNRAPFPGLAEVRALARTDLRAATLACARQTCAYTDRRGKRAHPATEAMILELEAAYAGGEGGTARPARASNGWTAGLERDREPAMKRNDGGIANG